MLVSKRPKFIKTKIYFCPFQPVFKRAHLNIRSECMYHNAPPSNPTQSQRISVNKAISPYTFLNSLVLIVLSAKHESLLCLIVQKIRFHNIVVVSF